MSWKLDLSNEVSSEYDEEKDQTIVNFITPYIGVSARVKGKVSREKIDIVIRNVYKDGRKLSQFSKHFNDYLKKL